MERDSAPLAVVAALPLFGGGWFDWEDDLTRSAREAVERAPFDRVDAALAEPPELDAVYEVNEHADGDPIYVPKVDVELADRADPDVDAAYRIAAIVVRALQPALADEHVRHYDVVFGVGERSWFDWGDHRRIAVTPEFAERLDREPSFDGTALREAVEDADDGDHEIAPVAWGRPLGHGYYHGSSGASVATTAATGT